MVPGSVAPVDADMLVLDERVSQDEVPNAVSDPSSEEVRRVILSLFDYI